MRGLVRGDSGLRSAPPPNPDMFLSRCVAVLRAAQSSPQFVLHEGGLANNPASGRKMYHVRGRTRFANLRLWSGVHLICVRKASTPTNRHARATGRFLLPSRCRWCSHHRVMTTSPRPGSVGRRTYGGRSGKHALSTTRQPSPHHLIQKGSVQTRNAWVNIKSLSRYFRGGARGGAIFKGGRVLATGSFARSIKALFFFNPDSIQTRVTSAMGF